MSIKQLNNAGDTIVEVMVVLAVLGLAIGISFSTASRSLKNARAAQENSEATALLQSQLESLRFVVADPTFVWGSLPASFCMNNTTIVAAGSATCNFNSFYDVTIQYVAGTNTFTLVSNWDDAQQKSYKDSVTLVYRPYK